MSTCQELMAPVREELAWRCETLPDGRTILVSTDRVFADGDSMSLLVRVASEDSVVVSDGGLVVGRLDLHDVPWEKTNSRIGRAWEEIRKSYGVEFANGRLYLRGSGKALPFMLSRLADAAVALDVLTQVHHTSEEPQRFSAHVFQWLRNSMMGQAKLEERFSVGDVRTGESYRFSKVTTSHGRSVLIKTVGGSSKQVASNAAYKVMFDLSRISISDWPKQNRLTIIQRPDYLLDSQLESLVGSAYVGSWDSRKRVQGFILGQVPDSANMV